MKIKQDKTTEKCLDALAIALFLRENKALDGNLYGDVSVLKQNKVITQSDDPKFRFKVKGLKNDGSKYVFLVKKFKDFTSQLCFEVMTKNPKKMFNVLLSRASLIESEV